MDNLPERIHPEQLPAEEDLIAVEIRNEALIIEIAQRQAEIAQRQVEMAALNVQLNAINAELQQLHHHQTETLRFLEQRAERRLLFNLGFFGEEMVNQIATLVTTSLQCL